MSWNFKVMRATALMATRMTGRDRRGDRAAIPGVGRGSMSGVGALSGASSAAVSRPLSGLVLGAVLGGALLAGPGTAVAAPMICGARDAVVAELKGRYGETRRSIGLQQGRGVVEVYASERTGSWTILLTNTDGRSCLIAAGEAFEAEEIATLDTPA